MTNENRRSKSLVGVIVFAMAAAVATGTEIKLTEDCTWANLVASVTDTSIVLSADSPQVVTVMADAILPDILDIGANVSVKVAKGVTFRRARQADIPAVTIRAGGYLGFHSQTARLLTPVDLSITTGGSLDMNYDASAVTRSAFVARTYYLDGVKQGAGTKKTSTDAGAPIRSRDTNSAVFVPAWFWTGASGDNVFETAGNWLGGKAPKTDAYSIYDSIDLSCAEGTITLSSANEFKVLGVSYLPAVAGSALALFSSNGAKISVNGIGGDYGVQGVCGLGATLVFDVAYENLQSTSRKIYSGGGTWRFQKDCNLNNGTAYPLPILDGAIEVAGSIQKTNLTWGRMGDHPSSWRFVGSADVSVDNLGSEASGWTSGLGYVQDGGSVSAKYLCGSTARWDGRGFLYELNGGSLDVTTELILGGAQKIANVGSPVWPTGSFTMNGGTLTAKKVSNEFNSNYCRLLGGTATIGTDGFVRSVTSRAIDGGKDTSIPNETSPIVLGAVTLLAEGAGWSVSADLTDGAVAGVSLEGSASGAGRTVFAPAEDQTITVNGTVGGTGGFVKQGAGGLVFAGTYAATGDVCVRSGTLTFGAVSGTLNALELANESNLSLGAGVTLQVKRLTIGGQRKPAGSYPFGSGSVQVPSDVCDYIGPEGGDWNTAANWSNGVVPNAADCELDFAYSSASSISLSAPVTVKAIAAPNGLTLTGEGVLTFADGGSVDVAAGKVLTNDAPVYVAGAVRKTGGGKVVFTKLLRSSADPATFEGKQGYEFRIVQGEGEVACTVNGIRLYADSQTAADDPLLTISEGSVVTNSYVHGPWTKLARAGYGRVVMNGGTVTIDGAEYYYGASGPNQREFGLAYLEFGSCSFTMNGGTFVANEADNVRLNLHNNANDNGGEVTVTINGGSFVRSREYADTFFGGSKVEKIVLNGGSFEVYNLEVSRSGRGKRVLELNGGTLIASRAISATFEPIKVGGEVTFAQRYKYDADNKQFKIEPAVSGTGKIIQSGTACLWLNDVSGFAGDFAVTGGSLVFTGATAFNAASALSVAKGATVALNYTGSKVVQALTLGGKPAYKDCAYGAAARGKSYFAGEGRLVSATGPDVPGMALILR